MSLWEEACGEGAHGRIFKDTLLDDARIRFWLLRHDNEVVAGCISFSSGTVTGLSNWFSKSANSVLDLGIMHPVAGITSGGPIVFWSSEDDAAFQRKGFRRLGALRVWMTGLASTR